MKDNMLDISVLIDSIGCSYFGNNLNKFINKYLDFDMSCMFFFSANQRAQLLYDGYSKDVSKKALNSYLKGGYLLDPFYVACISNQADGLWRMQQLAPDKFFSTDFIISKDVHPCISGENNILSEEIGITTSISKRSGVVFSFMRFNGRSKFSNREISSLEWLVVLFNSLIRKHIQLLGYSDNSNVDIHHMEEQFVEFFDDKITPQQSEIAKLVLRGHSVTSISKILSIKESTVKLHKSNMYSRLSISDQSDLFVMFIDFLSKRV